MNKYDQYNFSLRTPGTKECPMGVCVCVCVYVCEGWGKGKGRERQGERQREGDHACFSSGRKLWGIKSFFFLPTSLQLAFPNCEKFLKIIFFI